MKKKLFFLLIPCVLIMNCSHKDSSRYYSEKGNSPFSVQFPEEWEIQPEFQGTLVTALSPIKNEKDRFREYISCARQVLAKKYSDSEYYAFARNSLAKVLSGYKLLEESDDTINGKPVHSLTYIFTVTPPSGGNVTIKAIAFLLPSSETAFIITCGANPDEFNEYLPFFIKAAHSFRNE